MRSFARALTPLILTLIGSLLLGIRPTDAYECSRVQENEPDAITQVWQQTCIPYFISEQSELFRDSANASVAVNSFEQWSMASQACSSVTFVYSGYLDEDIAFDNLTPSNNHNIVTSLDTEAKLNQAKADGIWPDDQLVAITLTRFVPNTGEIVDSDIVLNNVKFEFADVLTGASCENNTVRHDLKNTIVHEVGHFIGFAHVTGTEATMYAQATNCETKKRDLAMDDIIGLCTVYPASGPIMTCNPPVSGYDASNIQAFRGQCSRLSEMPIEGCDCSTLNDQNKSFHLSVSLLFGLAFLIRSIRKRPH